MPADTFIFTEAGENIGFGHLTRCRTIQNHLLNKNNNCKLFLHTDSEQLYKDKEQLVVNWMDEPDNIIRDIGSGSNIIIDSYLAHESIYEKLLDNSKFLLAIDDYNRIVYPADLVLNPNLNFDILDYSNQKTKVIGGSDYIILREDIINNKSRFNVRKNINNILITLGGSDYRAILPELINMFDQTNYELFIVAGTEEYRLKIHQMHGNNNSIYGYLDACQMVAVMLESDLALSGCGQTLHELSYLGIPTIGICIDDDQIINMESYVKSGFLLQKLYWNEENLGNIILSLINKMNNYETRIHISEYAKQLNDGMGVERICTFLD